MHKLKKSDIALYKEYGWYFTPPRYTLTLTSEITHTPNIDAMLNGDETCFEKISAGKKLDKKKSLIISTFLFDTLDEKIKTPLLQLFQKALQDEFDIYITTPDGLTQLDNKNILSLDSLGIIPVHPKQIEPLASAINIASDDCVIYTGDKLLELARLLDAKYSLNLNTPAVSRKSIDETLHLHYQRIGLAHQKSSKDLQHSLTKQDKLWYECNKMPYPDELCSYIKLLELPKNIDQESMDELLEHDLSSIEHLIIKSNHTTFTQMQTLFEKIPHLKRLDLSGCKSLGNDVFNLTLDALANLEELNLSDSSITAAQLQILLEKTPNLKKLNLVNCINLDDVFFDLPHNALANLEELDLTGSTITAVQLQALIEKIPGLKKLNLSGCRGLGDDVFDLSHNALANLEELNLTGSSITAAQLQTMLEKATGLKKVMLYFCGNFGDTITNLSLAALTKLEELYLSYSPITAEQLQALLKKTPDLKKLHLINCEKAGNDTLNLLDDALANLEELDLSYSSITAAQLQALVKKIPGLKKINLSGCKKVGGDVFDLSHDALANLEELDLSNSSITAAQLQALLKKTSRLKKINLSGCKNLGNHVFDLSHNALLNLEELKLLDSSITAAQLQALLEKAPHLEKIFIYDCENLSNANFNLFNNTLINLEVLFLSGTSITTIQLQSLLEKTSRLKKINLSGCMNLGNHVFDLSHDALANLEELYLSGTSITAAQLQALLEKTPRLKKINLSGCMNLGNDVFKLLNDALANLEELNLSRSSITAAQLQALLEKTPRLKNLNIGYCPNLDFSQLQLRKGMLPNLTDLNLVGIDLNPFQLKQWIESSLQFINVDSPLSLSRGDNSRASYNPSIIPDGNLLDSNPTLEAREIFKGHSSNPPVSNYHLQSFQWQIAKDHTSPHFNLYAPQEDELEEVTYTKLKSPYEILRQFESSTNYSGDNYYYGQHELTSLRSDTWHQLPALSQEDSLKALATVSSDDYQIKRSKKTGYYYIKFNKTTPSCRISFIIESNSQFREKPRLNDDSIIDLFKSLKFSEDGSLIKNEAYQTLMRMKIQDRIDHLQRFCTFTHAQAFKNISGEPHTIFNYLLRKRAGVCRHRAQLFVALAENLGIDASFINNDVHAFVVVNRKKGKKYHIDLGGGTGTVKTIAMSKIEEEETVITSRANRIFDIASDNPFQTWKSWQLDYHNDVSLANALLSSDNKNQHGLVVLPENSDIEALHRAVVSVSQSDGKNCLFSRELDDLKLTTIHVDKQGGHQPVKSTIVNFITRAQLSPKETFTWFINWSDAKPQHTGFNTIIDDKNPRFGTHALPDNLKIVIVCDESSAVQMGEDFHSRLPVCAYIDALQNTQTPLQNTAETVVADKDIFFEDAFHWKKILLGAYRIQDKQFYLGSGALLEAIEKKQTSLSLVNAPWENDEFRWFMDELMQKRSFFFNGHKHRLPEGFTFTFAKPIFDFTAFADIFDKSLSESKVHVLNYDNYQKAFQQYCVTDAESIDFLDGWLLSPNHKNHRLVVTQTLTDAQWYTLCKTAKQHGIKLQIDVLPNVVVPKDIKPFVNEIPVLSPDENIKVIISHDIDAAANEYPDAHSIPITTETQFEKLFFHVSRSARSNFGFRGIETDLLKRLKNGETVILKGRFSEDLVHRLESLFISPATLAINGEDIPIKGKLVLLSDDKTPFASVKVEEKIFAQENIWQKLSEQLPSDLCDNLKLHYETLKVTPRMSHFQNIPENVEAQKAWVDELIIQINLLTGHLSKITEPTSAEEIITRLEKYPLLFLVSETGQGKSHFVLNTLKAELKKRGKCDQIFSGRDAIHAWLQTPGAILFLDETNLSPEEFELFDNLARGQRVIEIDGQQYEIPEGNSVIGAGNPSAYEGRFHLEFFERFPCFLQFTAPSLETIMQPVMTSFNEEDKKIVLDIVKDITQKALDANINFTARNAQMIALRIQALQRLCQNFPLEFLAQYAALHEIKEIAQHDKKLVKEYRKALKENSLYPSYKDALKVALKDKWNPQESSDFIWTKSREKIALSLLWLIHIRQLKCDNKDLQAFGLNGLVIEGEAGLGKSQLLIHLLKTLNIPYRHITTTDPVLMEKEMNEAFNKGEFTIIDEINTFPNEKLLNAYLSGTDLEGNPPNQSGFVLLATQNPIHYHGRQAASKASANRVLSLSLGDYNVNELQQILKKYEFGEEQANQMVCQFISAKAYAEAQRLFPAPTTRAFFQVVAEIPKPNVPRKSA